MMGIIEELGKIQKLAKMESAAKEKEAREEAEREAEEERFCDLASADSNLSKYLEEIKNRAKDEPFRTEATLSLGIVSRDYADRTAENLKKEGFVVVLKSRHHAEQDYGDEGYHGAYTTYTAWVNWK
jgi:hypothetical protein